MNKIDIESASQIDEIKSKKGFSLIFKHSTRCPVSRMALKRVESDEALQGLQIDYLYLDLLKHRDLSNYIAETFEIHHESPQIILVKDGECILDASHSAIQPKEIIEMTQS